MLMEWPENCYCQDDVEIYLIAACKSGNVEEARKFLSAGADLDSRDRSNFYNQFIGFTQSALQVAVNYGHHEIVELLLKNGADIQLRDRFGFNALHLACKKGHLDCVKVLLDYRSDVSAVRQDGERAIHYAAISGNPELIKLLIDHGANPNESDVYGYNPLSYAAGKGHLEACRILCQNGAIAKSKHITIAYKKCYADIVLFLFLHATDIDEEIAPKLHLSTLFGNSFDELLICDTPPNVLDEFGRTILHVAAKIGNLSAIEFALYHCSDLVKVSAEDYYGLTALHYACEPVLINFRQDAKSASDIMKGDLDDELNGNVVFSPVNVHIVEELVKNGAQVNILPEHNRWSPLCHACCSGDVGCVQALINLGADVNAGIDRYPLLTAVSARKANVVRVLLENKADPNISGSSYDLSWSALHLAVHNDDLQTAEILLQFGADANILDRNLQQTPLHLVNGSHGPDLVRLLVSHGANINQLKKHDESALHSACQSVVENVSIVEALIECGADLNAPGWFDRTPLHYACERGHSDIIECLVRAGANVNVREAAQNPELHTLEGRFTVYMPDTNIIKHAHFTPLASLLKYHLNLRKNTSVRALKSCRALTDVCSPDLLIDLTETDWASTLLALSVKCWPLVLELFMSMCGSYPLKMHQDLLLIFISRMGLEWLNETLELVLSGYETSVSLEVKRVKSLKSWSRIAVRKRVRSLNTSLSSTVSALPLPSILQSYLLMKGSDFIRC